MAKFGGFSVSGGGLGQRVAKKALNIVKDKAIDYATDKAKAVVMEKVSESPRVQEFKSQATEAIMGKVREYKEPLIQKAAEVLKVDEATIRQIWDTVEDPEGTITRMMEEAMAKVDTNISTNVDVDTSIGDVDVSSVGGLDNSAVKKAQRKAERESSGSSFNSYISEGPEGEIE